VPVKVRRAGVAVAEMGAAVHLAHPLGVKAFENRRVKNDQRDAADLADLLRMGRLSEARNRHVRDRQVDLSAVGEATGSLSFQSKAALAGGTPDIA
jgi:hypothetical protein